MKRVLLASALSLAIATPAWAHEDHEETAFSPQAVGAEFMVMETSANAAAREPFLRGLALLHNFEYRYAAEEFRRAQEADPDFVMAYWGEAMTYNHPLWDQQDRDAALAALARLGATPKARAGKARNARERAWLGAVETLYGTSDDMGDDPAEKTERDILYLEQMRALLAADPGDIDARAFTGLATLGSSHGGRQVSLYMEAAGLLEQGFMTHEMHPGILHYLIHSYDDPVHAPLGRRMAERYAVVAPDAGHAQHMVSHIFNGLGMWEESESANILADATVDRQRAAQGQGPTFCGHYNEWLVYALLQQGKDAREIVEGCRAQAEAELAGFEASGQPGYPAAAFSYGDMQLRYGIETGDWSETLGDTPEFYAKVNYDFANAEMLASLGDAARADAALAMLERHAAATIALIQARSAGADEISPWIEAAVAQGRAIRALSHGRTEEGLAMLRETASTENALPAVFGPPPIRKPSYELLGEVLLEMGRKEEAAEAFVRALELAPGRRLSLAGLEQASAR